MNRKDNIQSTKSIPLCSFGAAGHLQTSSLYTITVAIASKQPREGARNIMAIDEEKLQENLSHPAVLEAWGITKTERYAKVFGALHLVALVAMTAALIAYFVISPAEVAQNRTSGLIIVVVLIYAISAVRFLQIKAEKADIPDFKARLAEEFNGQDGHDIAAQDALEGSYRWPSRHYMLISRMAFITAFIVLMINTYQLGRLDFMRTVVFDLSILTYLLGSLWNNYTFKSCLLAVELEERLKAVMEYRDTHPEEFSDDDPDSFYAASEEEAGCAKSVASDPTAESALLDGQQSAHPADNNGKQD